MKRARALRHSLTLAAFAAFATVVSCRGIVGIEDQTVLAADGGGLGPEGGSPGNEAGTDASKPAPTASCTGKFGGDCQKCCRDLSPAANPILDEYVRACACGPSGKCLAECGTFCAGGQPGNPGPGSCIDCMVNQIGSPTCSAVAQCRANTTCAPIGNCIAGTCQ